MRLIDADALYKDMETCCDRSQFGRSTAKMCLKRAPTIDAVEITRCKDCVSYGRTTNDGYPRSYDCGVNGPNDFCSHALYKAYFEQEGEDDENE